MKTVVRNGLIAGALIVLGLVLRWASAGTLDHLSANDFGSLAGLIAAGVAWSAYGWLAIAVVLTALERLPGTLGRVAAAAVAAITSEGSRVLLRSALGVAVSAPLTIGVAHASPGDGSGSSRWGVVEKPSSVPMPRAATHRGDRLAIPDRPTVGAKLRYTPIRPASSVRVRRGDSLWAIAAREIGPDAPDAVIARRWPEWYAANAQRIGPDPDLINPGEVLDRPATHPTTVKPTQER